MGLQRSWCGYCTCAAASPRRGFDMHASRTTRCSARMHLGGAETWAGCVRAAAGTACQRLSLRPASFAVVALSSTLDAGRGALVAPAFSTRPRGVLARGGWSRETAWRDAAVAGHASRAEGARVADADARPAAHRRRGQGSQSFDASLRSLASVAAGIGSGHPLLRQRLSRAAQVRRGRCIGCVRG